MFTKLLGVPPQPNNGSWENVRELLVDPNTAHSKSASLLLLGLSLGLVSRTLQLTV